MHLSELLSDFYLLPSVVDRVIQGLCIDSRRVQPGDVFLALKGVHADGQGFISEAIAKGAVGVLAEGPNTEMTLSENIPLISLPALSAKLGTLGARFYKDPTAHLRLIGITGTNGKTSSSHFIAQILQQAGIACGLVGTLGYGFYGALEDTGFTTPDAIRLQALMHDLLTRGAKAVAMEVSSHSIDQGRINHVHFEQRLFTNLTQDHLDYHGSMDAYAAVKARFFKEWPGKYSIINADDRYGRQWIEALASSGEVVAYSQNKMLAEGLSVPSAYTENLHLSLNGINAYVHTPWGEGELALPLMGAFNLSNALATLCALSLYGLPFQMILKALANLKPVPGRMQTLGGESKPLVVVDYAHTPDALEKVLEALRAHTSGKLICVFGCGGDRDRSKRPQMARIAERFADQIIVTNDNPRHELPSQIAAEIYEGFAQPKSVLLALDRSKAIQKSIQWATARDCVLIAGKGAERYQQLGDEKIPFDDVEQVTRCLEDK